MTYYLTTDTRLTKRGECVTLYKKPHDTVWLVENERGVQHSINPELLSETPVVDLVVEIVEEINLFNQI